MRLVIQVLKEGSFTSETSFSQQIEGTPQYCTGYVQAIKDSNLGKVIVENEIKQFSKK